METTFQNQLTKSEMNRGLAAYIGKRLWWVLLMVMTMTFAMVQSWGYHIAVAGAFSVIEIGVIVGLVFITAQRQFKEYNVADYQIYEDGLAITNSNGDTQSYYFQYIKLIATRNLFVLCLPRNQFSIVAKRNMSEEQVEFLQKKIGKR